MVGYGSGYLLRLSVLSKVLLESSIWANEIHDDSVVHLWDGRKGRGGVTERWRDNKD